VDDNVDFSNFSILFIGDMNVGTRSRMRFQVLSGLVKYIKGLTNVRVPFAAGIDRESFYTRVRHKLGTPVDTVALHSKIKEVIEEPVNYNIIWIEKTLFLKSKYLLKIKERFPEAKVISISEDDMYAGHNRSRYYDACLNLYDIVFTTKKYNLDELGKLGARKVRYFLDSFEPSIHRPLDSFKHLDDKDVGVSFIGTFEKERSATLLRIANDDIDVHVFGNGWGGMVGVNPHLKVHNRPIYSEEYVSMINRSKINLGFLRKINRDQVTSRTMEIVGCQAFLLAERTRRHQELLVEGQEADFFSTDDELLEKLHYYLAEPELTLSIAKNGYRRSMESGYDMRSQMIDILEKCQVE
jgi:spore maturation protein CgeB